MSDEVVDEAMASRARPLLGIPGGPGFGAAYMDHALAAFRQHHRVTVFDPQKLGTDQQSFSAISHALALELDNHLCCENTVCVAAHSWGVVVLLAALAARPELNACGVLISPIPATWTSFLETRNSLMAKLSDEALTILATAMGRSFVDSELRTFLRHYVSPTSEPSIAGLNFDYANYQSVLATAEGYDVSKALPQVSRCSIIAGADDFTPLDHISDIVRSTINFHTIPEAGYFPHCEQPQVFVECAERCLATACCG